MIIEKSRNVHIYQTPEGQRKLKALLISDLHWDNPKCDRSLLKQHLEKAKKINAPVFIAGDLFCLMQGKGDPRKSKDDIRPEHNNARYLDSVVDTAVEWFKPYADVIKVIGYGNHETSIIKHQETDILLRFVTKINALYGSDIKVGGYGGWLVFKFPQSKKGGRRNFKIKYHHGYGGGGPVTKGTIQHQRMAASIEDADAIWMAHVHEDYEVTYSKEYLDNKWNVRHRDVTMIRTSSYKEEYKDNYGGFHTERGRPVKPLGGRWIEFYHKWDNDRQSMMLRAITYRTKN